MARAHEIMDRQDFALIRAQEAADPIFRSLDLPSAPPPMSGEWVRGYRERLAERLKHHSPVWRDQHLGDLPATTLAIAERQIYADAARAAATSCVGIPMAPCARARSWTRQVARGPNSPVPARRRG